MLLRSFWTFKTSDEEKKMQVHNLMEDIVFKNVEEIFDEEKITGSFGFCTCNQCRLDVACYVLNRIPPEYVVSGRGLVHLESDYLEKLQKNADLVALINEAIRKISTQKRPHFDHQEEKEKPLMRGPLFNFPTIIGRIFNGSNFEPVSGMYIKLLRDGELVEMINPNWQNPCYISEKTAGNYSFWPAPEKSKTLNNRKIFEFELSVEEKGFEPLQHFFEMELHAEDKLNDSIQLQKTFKVEDLYLFPQ